jgi:hypothetical protein
MIAGTGYNDAEVDAVCTGSSMKFTDSGIVVG